MVTIQPAVVGMASFIGSAYRNHKIKIHVSTISERMRLQIEHWKEELLLPKKDWNPERKEPFRLVPRRNSDNYWD
jgi:hypothetical protein